MLTKPMKTRISLCLLFWLLTSGWVAFAQSTINSTSSFIYSANAGWIDLRASGQVAFGVRVTESFCSGKAYAANFGWIDFGSGLPTNGFAYANNSATDFGVNVGSDGSLTGYAYAANVGWINFEQLYGFPKINLATGKFTGFIYSANVGWISLDTGFTDLLTNTIAYPDTDGDGIADAWEMKRFGNLTTANAISDFDKDGQSDLAEHVADTLPKEPTSRLRITSQTYNLGFTQNALQFTTSPSRLYRLEINTNLTGLWTNSPLGTFSPDAGLSTTRTINVAAGNSQFFRAVAIRPLQ